MSKKPPLLRYFLQASELASVPRMLVLAVTSLAIVLPMPLAVLSFRRHFRAVDALLTQLSSFELAETHCHCCDVQHLDGALVCDREVIYRCIGAWFGSKERFEALVRSEVLAICREQLGSCGLPYSWLVVAGAPVIWASSDAMVQAFVDGETLEKQGKTKQSRGETVCVEAFRMSGCLRGGRWGCIGSCGPWAGGWAPSRCSSLGPR